MNNHYLYFYILCFILLFIYSSYIESSKSSNTQVGGNYWNPFAQQPIMVVPPAAAPATAATTAAAPATAAAAATAPATGPRYPCPWPRKGGHTWNHATGKWIKITNKVSGARKMPSKKTSSSLGPCLAERLRKQNTRKADDITEDNYKNAVHQSSWNSKWGKLPSRNVAAVSDSSNSVGSAAQDTTSINEETLYKLDDKNVRLHLPPTVLALYNGEDGHWLSRAKIKKIIVEWDDGDTEHTVVDAKNVYYDPQ